MPIWKCVLVLVEANEGCWGDGETAEVKRYVMCKIGKCCSSVFSPGQKPK